MQNVDSGNVRQVDSSRLVRLSGLLLVGGLVFNAAVTMGWHPSGDEDNHPEIFAEYAADGGWVLTHFGQLVGVSIALAGLVALCLVLRTASRAVFLAWLGIGATVATAAMFAVLQGLDGVALKQAVDSWVATPGPQREVRFADAETLRWTEWGFQSYFRFLLGLTLALVGTAVVRSRQLPAWLGWLAVLIGLLSLAIGVDVGHNGLDSGFQTVSVLAFQAALLVFAVGIAVVGFRSRTIDAAAPSGT